MSEIGKSRVAKADLARSASFLGPAEWLAVSRLCRSMGRRTWFHPPPTRTYVRLLHACVRGARPRKPRATMLDASASLGLPGWTLNFFPPQAPDESFSLMMRQILRLLTVLPDLASAAFILREPQRPRLAPWTASTSGPMESGAFGVSARERMAW